MRLFRGSQNISYRMIGRTGGVTDDQRNKVKYELLKAKDVWWDGDPLNKASFTEAMADFVHAQPQKSYSFILPDGSSTYAMSGNIHRGKTPEEISSEEYDAAETLLTQRFGGEMWKDTFGEDSKFLKLAAAVHMKWKQKCNEEGIVCKVIWQFEPNREQEKLKNWISLAEYKAFGHETEFVIIGENGEQISSTVADRLLKEPHQLKWGSPIDVVMNRMAQITMGESALLKRNKYKYHIEYPDHIDDRNSQLVKQLSEMEESYKRLPGYEVCHFRQYVEKTLRPLVYYLYHARMAHKIGRKGEGVTFLHGGLYQDAQSLSYIGTTRNVCDLDLFEGTVDQMMENPPYLYNEMPCNGSAIVGRSDPCRPPDGRFHLDPDSDMTMVGHTPQVRPCPIVHRYDPETNLVTPRDFYTTQGDVSRTRNVKNPYKPYEKDKFHAALDTQYTDRKTNHHCMVVNETAKFVLRGKFKLTEPTYKTENFNPEQKIVEYEAWSTDPFVGTIIQQAKDTIFTCIGRLVEDAKEYDKRQLIFVSCALDPEQDYKFALRNGAITFFLKDPLKEIPKIQAPLDFLTGALYRVCGDVEASLAFFQGFLHYDKVIKEKYGLGERQLVVIGDVVGDPRGLSSIEEESLVLNLILHHSHFPNKEKKFFIIGNRDLNKLRMFEEKKYYDSEGMKQAARQDEKSLDEYILNRSYGLKLYPPGVSLHQPEKKFKLNNSKIYNYSIMNEVYHKYEDVRYNAEWWYAIRGPNPNPVPDPYF